MNDNLTQSTTSIPENTGQSIPRKTFADMIPRNIAIVAAIFLVWGVLSIFEMIEQLRYGMVGIELGALGIPMFFGLLRLRNGWRICALVLIWIVLAMLLLNFVLSFLSLLGYINFDGIKIHNPSLAIAITPPLFILAIWVYRVLTRPRTKRLFRRGGRLAIEHSVSPTSL